MSRYRDDRDDDFYGDRSRARRVGGGGYDEDRPSERERGGYGSGDDDRRGGGDYGARRDYEDYGRRRTSGGYGGGDREDYRGDERGERGDYYGGRRESSARDYDERERPRRYEEDDREGRSIFEEGRDFFRGRRGAGGGGRGEEGRRGATRSHVRCRDIMTRDVTVATRDTTLEEVARLMKNEDTGVIPVVDRAETPISTRPAGEAAAAASATGVDAPAGTSPEARRVNATIHGNGRLVGLITDRDIVVRAIAEGRDPRTTRAEEIMTEEVHTAHPNDRVIEAIRKMGDKQVRRIPIVDQDRTLRGIISMADVALETNDDRELAEALEEISSGSSFWNRIFG
ncbi:MAG TPA: CBS domain-containing protein [Pyrinomonadaceae bacterium]|nr:CBS domain-containing protein [Pyrinomonadaceae bacterium]